MAFKQWNGSSAPFNTAGDWSPSGTPGAADTADLVGSTAYSVTQSGVTSINTLIINNPSATLTVGGTLRASGGVNLLAGTILAGGTLANLQISLGGAGGASVLEGAFVSNLAFYPFGYVYEPVFGAGTTITTQDSALIGFSVNSGAIIAQSGTLTLSGAPNDGTHANQIGLNLGTVEAFGGLVIASAFTDYQANDAVPYGEVRIANGGIFEVADAFTRIGTDAITHANVVFADASGGIAIATNPSPGFLDTATLAVANFQAGNVIASLIGGATSFDAASNTLTFFDAGNMAVHAIVQFSSAHAFTAGELIGLGGASITTSRVITPPIGNGIPAARANTLEWLGQNGSFSDANQWTPAGPPGAGQTAELAGNTAYIVRQAGSTAVGTLLLNAALGTLALGGRLAASGGINLAAGALGLTGTIVGTSITQTGGSLLASSTGTLDGDRWIGTLNVAAGNAAAGLSVRNGLTLLAADGSSPGSLALAAGTLAILDSETLDRANFSVGGTIAGAAGLGFGAASTLVAGGSLGAVTAVGSLGLGGQILVGVGKALQLAATTLSVGGSVQVAGGSLALAAGSVLGLGGSIAISAGGTLALSVGALSGAGLSYAGLSAGGISLDASGVLALAGSVDFGGSLAVAGVGQLFNNVQFNGATLANGTLDGRAGHFAGGALTLSQFTWRGPLMVASGATLIADGSDRFLGASGTLAGTIDLTADNAVLRDNGTIDNVEIDLGNASIGGRSTLDAGGRQITVNPVLGAGVQLFGSGLASVTLARNFGDIIGVAGTLTLNTVNFGTVEAVGGTVIAIGYSDYAAGSVVPSGIALIANSGVFELAGTLAAAANLRFADNTGSLVIATDPALAATSVALAGFQNGNTIAASFATSSTFDAASNMLRFLYNGGGTIAVALSPNHAFSAGEFLGLGGGTITTSFVAQPLVNNFPVGTSATPQWLGQSGSFNDAANWSPIGVPGAGATASLAGTIAYSASQTGSNLVGGIILNAGLGTLGIGGTLTASNGLALQSGSLFLGGVLRNTIVTQTGGSLLGASNGTLDGDIWRGTLVVGGSLVVRNGLGLQAVDGSLPGSLKIAGGSLMFADTSTLDHAAISLGGTLAAATNLTFGGTANLTISGSGALAGSVVNGGLVSVAGGQTLTVGGSFTNSGTLIADGGQIRFASTPGNSGSIIVRHAGEIDVGSASLAGLLAAGITLDASSSLVVTGTLDLGGGTLALGTTLPRLGFRGATLVNGVVDSTAADASGAIIALGNIVWHGPLNLAAGATLQVDNASRFTDVTGFSPGTISIAGGATLSDTAILDNVQITLGDAGTGMATLAGAATAFGPGLTLGANASIATTGHATVSIGTNLGAITASGGTLILADTGAAGSIISLGGLIYATSFTTGTASGTVSIGNHGTFALVNAVADNSGHTVTVRSTRANVAFADAAGTLDIAAATFAPFGTVLNVPAMVSVSGFQAGDSIISTLGTASFDAASNTISFYDAANSVTTAVLNLGTAHSYTLAELAGLGGGSVTTGYAPGGGITACFASGTRIATARGDIPVEALVVGDVAITEDGGAEAIIWIGHRTVDCSRHPRPHDVMPVCVRRQAFGSVPNRDVLLSPDHGIFQDGVLIPVRYLLNGATIRQQPVLRVTYWHIELARHAIVLADGLPVESYLDTGNRHAFSNAGPLVQAHPDFARAVWAREGAAPLCVDGPGLLAARQLLDGDARRKGFTLNSIVAPYLLVDGLRVDPVLYDGRWQFNLASAGRVHLMSRRACPADADPGSSDRRLLGVAVRGMWFDGEALALDGAVLGGGWHAWEDGWRWTDGAGELHLDGIGVLEVDIALAVPGWQAPAPQDTSSPIALRTTAFQIGRKRA